jgi:hypothetical protein
MDEQTLLLEKGFQPVEVAMHITNDKNIIGQLSHAFRLPPGRITQLVGTSAYR